MSRQLDLVKDSKLRTDFHDSITIHSYVDTDTAGRRFSRKEHWKWEKFLGRGGFGQVRLQRCVTKSARKGCLRAVKIINKSLDPSGSWDFNRELEAIAKFSNDRYKRWFVKSFGWYEDPTKIFISMEYCLHGDLDHYLKERRSMSVGEAQQLTYQILEGLDQMHQNDFAHRDLKPGNILIKSMPPAKKWWIVLADFGISKRADENNGHTTVIKGTSAFMAPELLGCLAHVRPKSVEDFKATDMWALGEIIFQMLTGEPTFRNPVELVKYCDGQQTFPSNRLPISASDDGRDFVICIMMALPQHRLTATKCIQHRWMESLRVEEFAASESDLEQILPEISEISGHESASAILQNESASARWSTLSDQEKRHTRTPTTYMPVDGSGSPPPESSSESISPPPIGRKRYSLPPLPQPPIPRKPYSISPPPLKREPSILIRSPLETDHIQHSTKEKFRRRKNPSQNRPRPRTPNPYAVTVDGKMKDEPYPRQWGLSPLFRPPRRTRATRESPPLRDEKSKYKEPDDDPYLGPTMTGHQKNMKNLEQLTLQEHESEKQYKERKLKELENQARHYIMRANKDISPPRQYQTRPERESENKYTERVRKPKEQKNQAGQSVMPDEDTESEQLVMMDESTGSDRAIVGKDREPEQLVMMDESTGSDRAIVGKDREPEQLVMMDESTGSDRAIVGKDREPEQLVMMDESTGSDRAIVGERKQSYEYETVGREEQERRQQRRPERERDYQPRERKPKEQENQARVYLRREELEKWRHEVGTGYYMGGSKLQQGLQRLQQEVRRQKEKAGETTAGDFTKYIS